MADSALDAMINGRNISLSNDIETVTIGGVQTTRITRLELAQRMISDCCDARSGIIQHPKIVVSSNGSFIAAYHSNACFNNVVNKADIIDADGMPLVIVSRLFCKRPLIQRVATTDFIHDASRAAIDAGLRFFFLGGKPGVAAKATQILQSMHPGLEIVGSRHGYFEENEIGQICEEILAAKTDVLWVGLGTPLQEDFAVRCRDRLSGVGWIRTCGGLFDHYSGNSKRAPMWMQRLGLEWLFRATLEPNRLGKRYLLTNPIAAFHLLTKTHD